MLSPSSCSPTVPLRCYPSSRSFTMWKKEILIMSTWPSSFSSSLQKTMPSIAPSTRWWVDTQFNTHCSHWHSKPSITCNCWDYSKLFLVQAPFLSFSHSQVLKNVSWYTERSLTEISLGSLLILVVIRTIQFNMTRTRVSCTYTQTYSLTLCICKNNVYIQKSICCRHIYMSK